jgi:hypothetical protein
MNCCRRTRGHKLTSNKASHNHKTTQLKKLLKYSCDLESSSTVRVLVITHAASRISTQDVDISIDNTLYADFCQEGIRKSSDDMKWCKGMVKSCKSGKIRATD